MLFLLEIQHRQITLSSRVHFRSSLIKKTTRRLWGTAHRSRQRKRKHRDVISSGSARRGSFDSDALNSVYKERFWNKMTRPKVRRMMKRAIRMRVPRIRLIALRWPQPFPDNLLDFLPRKSASPGKSVPTISAQLAFKVKDKCAVTRGLI